MKLRAALVVTAASLALAAPAFAGDNGEGLVGETNDKIITFFSLGVIVFFTLVVITGSAMQAALERRKQAREARELRQRSGWERFSASSHRHRPGPPQWEPLFLPTRGPDPCVRRPSPRGRRAGPPLRSGPAPAALARSAP
jgi:hypothetical protein